MSNVNEKLYNEVPENKEGFDNLETAQEKKERWHSIWIATFTMFLIMLGFSIVLTAVWPYLDLLDPTAGKVFMGYVVAANPLGQMLFSPIMGYWANKQQSIRMPMITAMIFFIVSNVQYSLLAAFDDHRKYWMIAGRFLVGMSSSNVTLLRSYLASATRIKERTKAMSMLSIAQVLGFVIGPVAQGLFTYFGKDGYSLGGNISLNMYTSTGWFNAILGIINLILFLPYFFKEHKIAAREAMLYQGKTDEKDTWKSVKPDYLASWTLIFTCLIHSSSFVLLETLATSITMDHFAWTKADSLLYMGFILGTGAVLSIFGFYITNRLSKIFLERKILLWGGLFITTIACLLFLPWSNEPPKLALPENYTLDQLKDMITQPDYKNLTLEELVLNLAGDEELLGCPVSQSWCDSTRAVVLSQFLLAYLFAMIGYPIGLTLIQAIFSKVLGPRPQGVWMGLLTGAGCLSRVIGPVFVSFVYSQYGPVWTFAITSSAMIVCMIWVKIVNKRLVPFDLGEQKGNITIDLKEYKLKNENGGAMSSV